MGIINQIIKENSETKIKYITKIHGILNYHPYITIPKKIFDKINLKLGNDVFIKINYDNRIIPFISYLTKGGHVILVCVPKVIIEEFKLNGNAEIEVEIIIKQDDAKEGFNNKIDLLSLDLYNVSRFIHENRLYIRYKNRKTRQHVINRFVDADKELAYIIGLYDAEGAEKSFRFTNSDPRLIKTFLDSTKNIFGLDESEFDAQITLVNKNMKSERARIFWSNLFPSINIYKKAGFKYGDGIEHGSLSVLINTTTLNIIWNAIRKRVKDLLINDNELSAAYISGVLDGDGNVHKNKSLEVRCTFDINKGYFYFSRALENLKVFYKVIEVKDKNQYTITIRKWGNIMKLFNNEAIFKNNVKRKEKLIKCFIEHRRSKVILRTLKAIEKGNQDEYSICNAMDIQRKHIARLRSYLKQLESHKMISFSGGKVYLEEEGKNFLRLYTIMTKTRELKVL